MCRTECIHSNDMVFQNKEPTGNTGGLQRVEKGVIASQCAHWRTPGWPLLPLRGNSPSGNLPNFQTFSVYNPVFICSILGIANQSADWFAMTSKFYGLSTIWSPPVFPAGFSGLFAVNGFQMIDPGGIIGHKADIFVVTRAHEALLYPQARLHQAVAVRPEGFRFRGHGV